MQKYLHIKSIQRITTDGEIEELEFVKGVNIITGKPNTGKTSWLKQIDFLLGKNANIKEAFADEELAKKYIEISGNFEINGEDVIISRKPLTPGLSTKIFLGGEPIDATEFSVEILRRLDLPDDIRFPKGNPYSSQWVELSFRAILRHIYRREDLWNDIADKQPLNEQYAAQFQLLGIAKYIYSKEYAQTVINEKELNLLEAQRQQYNTILNQIVQDMAPKDQELLHYATENEIQIRIAHLESELIDLENKRRQIVQKHLDETSAEREELIIKEEGLIAEKVNLVNRLEILANDQIKLKKKQSEYLSILESITDELLKLKRTKKTKFIADLKITHCPACDQLVESRDNSKDAGNCFLCHLPLQAENKQITIDRIGFEINQLESEKSELQEINKTFEKEATEISEQVSILSERLYYVERELMPLKDILFSLTHQDLTVVDVQRGRIEEQIRNYQRLLISVLTKDDLSFKIQTLVHKIEKEKEKQTQELEKVTINFTRIAKDLEYGMQYYVDRVSKTQKVREIWSHHGKISIGINESKVAFYVNNKSWDSLGARDKEIFLLSYHFGLLTLTAKYNYPGIVIIDLPPELGDVKENSYNYIAEPFSKYCKILGRKKPLQVIFAGRSFENIIDSNIIDLNTVWK